MYTVWNITIQVLYTNKLINSSHKTSLGRGTSSFLDLLNKAHIIGFKILSMHSRIIPEFQKLYVIASNYNQVLLNSL